jgi:putative DNA primase/helicase
MAPRLTVEDAVGRYWGTYGFGGKVLFDAQERRLVHRDDVMNLLPGTGWSP